MSLEHFDNNKLFNVYVRSMITYTDHHHRYLQPANDLNIFRPIGFFLKYTDAEKWILKNGKKITDDFYEMYTSPCAFCIIEQGNVSVENEYFEDYIDELSLYWCNKGYPTFVFNEKCYKMVMDENFIYVSHDWSVPNADWIRYVKDDGTIFRGSDDENFERCVNDYFSSAKQRFYDEYNKLKDNNRTPITNRNQDIMVDELSNRIIEACQNLDF